MREVRVIVRETFHEPIVKFYRKCRSKLWICAHFGIKIAVLTKNSLLYNEVQSKMKIITNNNSRFQICFLKILKSYFLWFSLFFSWDFYPHIYALESNSQISRDVGTFKRKIRRRMTKNDENLLMPNFLPNFSSTFSTNLLRFFTPKYKCAW